MKPNNADYRSWKESVFGSEYMIWHDGLDTDATKSLVGEARENALRMLMFGVNIGDGHAASALAGMGETSAVAEIRAALSKSDGENKVRFARALQELSPEDAASDSMAKKLVEVLENSDDHWGPQIRAAIGLRDFDDAESERALLKAVEHDKEYLVRYHSVETLLVRWHVKPAGIGSHSELFGLICDPQEGDTRDEPSRRREAILKLESLRK